MPTALHPQAKFDPIPPDLDLQGLVENTPNFSWVLRVSMDQIRNLSQPEFEKLVNIHVIQQGKPLVISGWNNVLPKRMFSAEWLEETYDKKQETVRDISNQSDIPMTMGHYLRSMCQLTNQWTPANFRDERRQRLYLKDIDCPPEWAESLHKIIPPNVYYMNANVTDRGDSVSDDDWDGDIFRRQVQAAPAGDLMSSLPEEMRAQNLMCYIGHEGTYTPAHREMCATLGQNIMVEASGSENGEKPGSSIWFMTEIKDRDVVREYFLSMLGHDIEIEKHFAQINAWKKATFPVYVVEQKPGDFILIPPLAAHQVWNRGTRTIKVAWNRTTVETLELAMKEALPKAKLVCRDEQYKNKAIIYYTLQKYAAELEKSRETEEVGLLGLEPGLIRSSPRTQQLTQDFKRLFHLFSDILTDEMFANKEKNVEFIPFDSCITCSYCRSNIFNRFLTCKHCIRPLLNGDEDTYDVCMECYAMGRSCLCTSGHQWCEQWDWAELVDKYETWRTMIIRDDGFVDLDTSPLPLEIARRRRGKKSLAQVCQEALKRRPFKDVTKPEPEPEPVPSESEPEVDDNGRVKKKKKRKNTKKKKHGDIRRCHVCCHKDYTYKLHECSNPGCSEAYCYGVLYRAYDMTPQSVLESEYWQCPKCLGICNCGACRRAGNTNPYMPKNTSLGHDTRPIADDRSIEVLVDFRMHNLGWLRAAGEESRSKNSKRMQRLREQADVAKSQHQIADGEALPVNSDGANAIGLVPCETNGHPVDVDAMDVDGARPAPNGDGSLGAPAQNGMPAPAAPMLPPDHPLALVEAALHGAGYGVEGGDSNTDADTTQYPDPTMLAPPRPNVGMGYYEQDDTPDKILFDPYQMPTIESLNFDEPDVSEYLKKTIRAAKRKARQEEEDPDFMAGRHAGKKKQKKDHQQQHQDIELDPALFNTPGSAREATAGAEEGQDHGGSVPPEGEQQSARPTDEDSGEVPVLGLSLRRAKPRYSYTEVEEMDSVVDDPDSLLPFWASGKPRKPKDPKIIVLDGDNPDAPADGDTSCADGTPRKSQEQARPKKRGRPPKSRLGSVVTTDDVAAENASRAWTADAEDQDDALQRALGEDLERALEEEASGVHRREEGQEQEEDAERGGRRPRRSAAAVVRSYAEEDDDGERAGLRTPPPAGKRRRGRPRKSDVAAATAQSDPEEDEDEQQTERRIAPSEGKRRPGRPRKSDVAAAAAAAQSDSEEDEDEQRPERRASLPEGKRRPGQPRKSDVAAVAAQSHAEDEDGQQPKGKRRPGRPRKSDVAARTTSPSAPPASSPTTITAAEAPAAAPKSTKMMPMAERMRLKGKTFKIGKRKARASAGSFASSTAAPSTAGDEGSRPASALPARNKQRESRTERRHGRPELDDDGYESGGGRGRGRGGIAPTRGRGSVRGKGRPRGRPRRV